MPHVNLDEPIAAHLLMQLIQDISRRADFMEDAPGGYVLLTADKMGMSFLREDATGEPIMFIVKRASVLEFEKLNLVEELIKVNPPVQSPAVRDPLNQTFIEMNDGRLTPVTRLGISALAALSFDSQDKSQRAAEDAVPDYPGDEK